MIIISNLPDGDQLVKTSSNHGKDRALPMRTPPSRSGSGTPLYRMLPGRTDSDLSTLSSHSTGSAWSADAASDVSSVSQKSSTSSTTSTASSTASSTTSTSTSTGASFVHSYKKPTMPPRSQYLAMDCEMCGTLTGQSVCARVVLTDWKGRSVYDSYVSPSEDAEPITDYRTFVSGITKESLEGAPTLQQVQQTVLQHLDGKILVGHGLENDLKALQITHSWYMMRDTAHYEPFMKSVSSEVYARSPQGRRAAASQESSGNVVSSSGSTVSSASTRSSKSNLLPRKLKDLAKSKLNRDIQQAGQAHSPVEDAVAALDLYKSHRPRWEACVNSQLREASRKQGAVPSVQAGPASLQLPAHVVQQQQQFHQQQAQAQQMALMQQQQAAYHQYQHQHRQYQNLPRPRYYQQAPPRGSGYSKGYEQPVTPQEAYKMQQHQQKQYQKQQQYHTCQGYSKAPGGYHSHRKQYNPHNNTCTTPHHAHQAPQLVGGYSP